MLVDRSFVLQQQLLIGPVRDRHDVDVPEFRSRLAPVTVRENVMPPHFAARLNFASGRHRPMEKRIETGDAHAAGGRLDVLEKGRETSDDLSRVERLRDPAKFLRIEAGLPGPRLPGRRRDFFRRELPFQRDQDFPLQLADLRDVNRSHRGRFVGFASGLDRFPANMTHAQE